MSEKGWLAQRALSYLPLYAHLKPRPIALRRFRLAFMGEKLAVTKLNSILDWRIQTRPKHEDLFIEVHSRLKSSIPLNRNWKNCLFRERIHRNLAHEFVSARLEVLPGFIQNALSSKRDWVLLPKSVKEVSKEILLIRVLQAIIRTKLFFYDD